VYRRHRRKARYPLPPRRRVSSSLRSRHFVRHQASQAARHASIQGRLQEAQVRRKLFHRRSLRHRRRIRGGWIHRQEPRYRPRRAARTPSEHDERVPSSRSRSSTRSSSSSSLSSHSHPRSRLTRSLLFHLYRRSSHSLSDDSSHSHGIETVERPLPCLLSVVSLPEHHGSSARSYRRTETRRKEAHARIDLQELAHLAHGHDQSHQRPLHSVHQAEREEGCLGVGRSSGARSASSLWSAGDDQDQLCWIPESMGLRGLCREVSFQFLVSRWIIDRTKLR